MGKFIDLTGQQFNHLTALKRAENKNGRACFLCRCDCGAETVVPASALKSGNTKSCGCLLHNAAHNSLSLVGNRYGRLVVLKRVEDNINPKYRKSVWLCKCDCGKTKIINGTSLVKGQTRSCGCLCHEVITRHGMGKTRLYHVWWNMIYRCYNPKAAYYKNYGGRGITVCEGWLGESGLQNFYDWAIANGYDESAPRGKYTIDRINSNGNYEPSNCRWVDNLTQQNNKQNTCLFEYNGELLTIPQLSRKFNIPTKTLYSRVKRGATIKQAIEDMKGRK